MVNRNKVCITGMGAVSAAGVGVEAQFNALQDGRCLFSLPTHFKSSLGLPVAENRLSNKQFASLSQIAYDHSLSRSFYLGMPAATEALLQAGLSQEMLDDAAFVFASTGLQIEVVENIYDNIACNGSALHNSITGDLARLFASDLGLRCEPYTVSTACSSGTNALVLAKMFIESGMAQTVLVGSSEALSRFSLDGFNSLEIVSSDGCHPFSSSRDGITLGEAAAFVVLEAEEHCLSRRTKPLAYLSGAASTNEGYHVTAACEDGSMAALAITGALADAGISAAQVDYVNAHATGTKINDLSESMAIACTLGRDVPVSGSKGLFGHTLAACGILETVVSILSFKNNILWPNFRLCDSDPAIRINLLTSSTPFCGSTILSLSLGFGGSDAAVVLKRAV